MDFFPSRYLASYHHQLYTPILFSVELFAIDQYLRFFSLNRSHRHDLYYELELFKFWKVNISAYCNTKNLSMESYGDDRVSTANLTNDFFYSENDLAG